MMSWFRLPFDNPDSLFNIQLRKFYDSIRITKDQATLIPPDVDETNDYSTDIVSEGLIPNVSVEKEPKGRPVKNTPEKISKLKRRIPITKLQRQNVYSRCKNICEYCDSHTDFLEVHHKDGNPANNYKDNLMGCCPNCHKKLDRLIQNGRRMRV